MATSNEQAEKHIGQTKGMSNYGHDLVHDLSTRLDALWRYDQSIANAETAKADDVKQLWQDLKAQEMKNVERLKEIIRQQVKDNKF